MPVQCLPVRVVLTLPGPHTQVDDAAGEPRKHPAWLQAKNGSRHLEQRSRRLCSGWRIEIFALRHGSGRVSILFGLPICYYMFAVSAGPSGDERPP